MSKLLQQTLSNLPLTPILPNHLIVDKILPRLPVKTLIRFKAVSKFWHSVISSPVFAKSHLKFRSRFTQQCLLVTASKNLLLLPYDDSGNMKSAVPMDFTLGLSFLPQHTVKFVGSCNGLLCLYNTACDYPHQGFYSLCNPALHQYLKITNPCFENTSSSGCWFGYTSSTDDYKIIAPFSPPCIPDAGFINEMTKHFYVYSFNTGQWKRNFDLDTVDYVFDGLDNRTTVLNDILYWSPLALDNKKRQRPKRIFGFNIVTENLIQFSWMDWLNGYVDACFFIMNGCLSLLCHRYDQMSDVWRLKQHDNWSSWEKFCSVNLGDMILLSATPSGKFLVHQYCSTQGLEQYKIFELCEQTQQPPQRDAYSTKKAIMAGAAYYVESLISPYGMKSSAWECNEV